MRRNSRSTIIIAIFGIAIFISQASSGSRHKKDNTIKSNSLYHIGWVWPDSLPGLQRDLIIDDNGLIYVMDKMGKIYCLQENGTIYWTYRGDYKYATALLCATNNSVLFLSSDKRIFGKIVELNSISDDGNLLWKFKGDRRFFYEYYKSKSDDLFIEAGRDYGMGSYEISGFYRISPDGIAHYFDWPIKGEVEFWGVDNQNRLVVSDSSRKKLMFLSSAGEILEVGRNRKWDRISKILADGDRLYIADNKNKLYAYDSDFKLDWFYRLGGYVYRFGGNNIVVGEDNNILVQTRNGRIYSIDKDRGKIKWRQNLESYVTTTFDLLPLPHNHVLIVGDRGTLSVLDDSGNLIWHYTMYDPGSLGQAQLSAEGDFYITQAGRLYMFTTDTTQIIAEKEPVPLPASLEEAKQEVAAFLLDHISDVRAGSLGEYIENTDQVGDRLLLTPPHESLIVYYPPKRSSYGNGWTVDSKKPLRVWVSVGNMIIEQSDKREAIDNYRNRNDMNSITPWRYAIYNFCIISISEDFQNAEVQIDFHCGRLCGNGTYYKLQRTPSGKWFIADSRMTWIS